MAGTIYGKIDCRSNSGGGNERNQEVFKNIFDFFERLVTVGYCTRIALQYGSGGTGTDYHDEANPFGENAFAVFRFNGVTSGNAASQRDGSTYPDIDMYILIQWADVATWGGAPGDDWYPGLVKASSSLDGVGIAFTWRTDGASPWGGSTNNDGTDAKSDPVWVGGTALRCFPVSNHWDHATSKQNTHHLMDTSANDVVVNAVANADGIVIELAGDSDPLYGNIGLFICGVYEPLPDAEVDFPFFAFGRPYNIAGGIDDGYDRYYGEEGGNSGYEGMIDWGGEPMPMNVYCLQSSLIGKNPQFSPTSYGCAGLGVGYTGFYNSGDEFKKGMPGIFPLDLFMITAGMGTAQPDYDATKSFMFVEKGIPTYAIAWDGTTSVFTSTRAGVEF